jgi:hypothetical protein
MQVNFLLNNHKSMSTEILPASSSEAYSIPEAVKTIEDTRKGAEQLYRENIESILSPTLKKMKADPLVISGGNKIMNYY